MDENQHSEMGMETVKGVDERDLIFILEPVAREIMQILEASDKPIGLGTIIAVYQQNVAVPVSRFRLEKKLMKLVRRGLVGHNQGVYYLNAPGTAAITALYHLVDETSNVRNALYNRAK